MIRLIHNKVRSLLPVGEDFPKRKFFRVYKNVEFFGISIRWTDKIIDIGKTQYAPFLMREQKRTEFGIAWSRSAEGNRVVGGRELSELSGTFGKAVKFEKKPVP